MEPSHVQACKIAGILQTHRKPQGRIETVLNGRTSTKAKAAWHSNHHRGHNPRVRMHYHIMPLHWNRKDHNHNHQPQVLLHSNQASHHRSDNTTQSNPMVLLVADQVNPL